MPLPPSKQLSLTKADREALRLQLQEDWQLGSRDMAQRQHAYRRWIKLWRAAANEKFFPDQDVSNYHVPLTQWQVLAKVAKEMDALLGDDAEIVVRPRGPADIELAPKIARYLNWRVKTSLKLFKKLYDYLLQKIVLGTTIGYIPWKTKKRLVRRIEEVTVTENVETIDPSSGLPIITPVPRKEQIEREEEVIEFEGPDLIVENLEDWYVPASAKGIEDAQQYIRRLRLTVDEILAMADDGWINPVSNTDAAKMRLFAETGTTASETDSGKEVRDEKKEQAGLPAEGSEERQDERLTVVNWFGQWRGKSAKAKERAQEIVAFYQPDLDILLGVARLVDLFPDGRRPHIKSELIRDIGGSFWGIGLPEFLESTNAELDAQHNALTDAGIYALGPLILYEPAAGFNPQTFTYKPFQCVPVANANGVKSVNLANINMGPYVALQSQLLGMAERVSGLTEAELGRPFSQPNAPRTLGQQQIISAGSGVRLLLDLRLERESLRELINRIWELDKRYLPKPLFFRVSESEQLEKLTSEEMMGDYDFDIGPLSGTANKAEEAMRVLQGHTLALQNPVTMQNPVYLMESQKKVNKVLGLEDLNAYLPDMAQLAPPKNPELENAMMLQGIDVDPHPFDNHPQHIAKHTDFRQRMAESIIDPTTQETMAQRIPGLLGNIDSHIAEHQAAMKQAQMGAFMPGKPAGQGGIAPTNPNGAPDMGTNELKAGLNQGGLNLG